MGLFSKKKQSQPSLSPQHTAKLQSSGRHAHQPPLVPFPTAGLLPPPVPPRGWNHPHPAGSPAQIPCHNQDPRLYPPIIVNQHYYLNPAPLPPSSSVYPSNSGSGTSSKLKLGSTSDLIQLPANVISQIVDDGLPRWHTYGTQLLNQGAALYDQISSKFDDVMTLIDRDKFLGNESDLFTYQQPDLASSLPSANSRPHPTVSKDDPKKKKSKDLPKGQASALTASAISGGYFAKVDLYANSRLPLDLPVFRTIITIYPLLCLAAQYSERVYQKPQGPERNVFVEADWRTGTKSHVIKSVPMDNMGTIVFAIRGTASFMDWAVNLNTAPTAPTGFLDDVRNFCHAGFLSVARKMVAPVASRLRQILEEDPGRCAHSLLITGHSAGGAIASLLYMHMLATSKAASSELNLLTGCFRRVHCITFGSPPVSLFPLQTPRRLELRKSIFYSFVNEGDPVTRADKAYVKSLLELFAAPAPTLTKPEIPGPTSNTPSKPSKQQGKKSKSTSASKTSKWSKSNQSLKSSSSAKGDSSKVRGPIWRVPPSTLSNAGQIVVLRSADTHTVVKRAKTVEERLNEGVVAQVASDEKLRSVIWGDPVCHVMRLYAARIERLAVEAVTAKGR